MRQVWSDAVGGYVPEYTQFAGPRTYDQRNVPSMGQALQGLISDTTQNAEALLDVIVPNQYDSQERVTEKLLGLLGTGTGVGRLETGGGALKSALSRPVKTNTRPTVSGKAHKVYPGIYKDPRQLVEEGAARVAPENKLMSEFFGVDRSDLDAMTRAQEKTINQVDIPVWPTTQRGAQHTQKVMNPTNEARLQDVLSLAGDNPQFTGSYGWYQTLPLREKYRSVLGKELGDKRFDEFMQSSSVMSAGSPVDLELRRASLAGLLDESGELDRFIKGNMTSGENVYREFPELFKDVAEASGYGHIYHATSHRPALERYAAGDKFFNQKTILEAPKTPNYYYSKTGENLRHPTQDAHFVRGIGLSDVRPMTKAGTGASVKDTEAGKIRDWWTNKVSGPVGMSGSPAQALLWNSLAPQTGVKTLVGKPLLELITDGVEREALKQAKSPQQALLDFINRSGKLGSFAGAGLLGHSMTGDGGDI